LISSPFQKAFWGAGKEISDFFETFSNNQKIKEENKELELRVQELLVENNYLSELEKENKTLKEALGIGLEEDFELIFGQVIAKDIFKDIIKINKGSEDGVSEGMPAITSQKVLVGKVGKVYNNFSEIVLISNTESSFDAEIAEKEIYGVVKGLGNFEIYLDLIPKEEEIAEKDLIFTAALGGVFPKGILVGEIEKVEKKDIETFQTARLKPIFNIKEAENLFIISNFGFND